MGDDFRARCVRSWFGLSALVALGAAAPASGLPTPVHDPLRCARPALWVVSDQDTTIYLFGTIHTHDGRAHWFDHAVRRAFDASDSLVLETLVPSAPARVEEPAGSGLVRARETIGVARTVGFRVELGADLVLHRAADAVGKPVIGLESFDSQLNMYRTLPSSARPATPAAAPVAGAPIAADPALAPFLRSVVDSWNKGDARPIEAVVGAVRSQSPETYRRLFSSRNETWAEWIDSRLQRPGTVFLAVGSGHLVGVDSLQAKLLQRGIRSARVN